MNWRAGLVFVYLCAPDAGILSASTRTRPFRVGPRPVTADGLPVVGPTRVPGVYVAGGHGMWGITLGPVTGRLLALSIATGGLPEALGAFTALR
jgi:glycine/D-amino acid oxidase-like deaminating enzyme